MKRAVDIVLALGGLIVLAPVLAGIGAMIALVDGLPVLFRHLRVGRGGRDFRLYKFRTMRPLAGAEGGGFEPGDTRRVTRFGAFLRRTKLDELPQLWNVLRGDMSFVGPRPEVRPWVEAYPERWKTVLAVRPGITDPASLAFRSEEALLSAAEDREAYYRDVILPRKLDLYEAYARERSLPGDLVLIARTLAALLQDALCEPRAAEEQRP